MPQEDAFNDRANDFLLFRVESGDGFKLQTQLPVGAAFVFAEKQLIGCYAKRHRQLPDYIESRLRRAGFVSY